MSVDKANKHKLTKRLVESTEPDLSKRTVLWDTEVTGFCVRIYPSGKKFVSDQGHCKGVIVRTPS